MEAAIGPLDADYGNLNVLGRHDAVLYRSGYSSELKFGTLQEHMCRKKPNCHFARAGEIFALTFAKAPQIFSFGILPEAVPSGEDTIICMSSLRGIPI